MKTQFDVTGMSCAACSARVQKAVETLEAATDVQVNLLTNSMTVEYDDTALTPNDIILKVKAAGYGAAVHDPKKSAADPDDAAEAAKRRRLVLSLGLLLPLMYVSMGHMVGAPLPSFLTGHDHAHIFALVQLVLTLAVLIVNRQYFVNGFCALLKRAPNMDSLIAMGASAAFFYGVAVTVQIILAMRAGDMDRVAQLHGNLYFESAAMIVTLVDVGKFLEERSKGRTKAALQLLTALKPATAQVLRGGAEVTVDAAALAVGDIVVVRPGTKVPADGVIVSGTGYLDQSALTGESMPAEKTVGDDVLCASVNTSGAFQFEATRVGDATTLSQMIALSLEAAGSKAPISRLADRVSRVFVPAVICVALVCFGVWFAATRDFARALNYAISVLVISCPCALGLATPVAIMVGTGQAAKNGLLFKSAAAMERLRDVDTIVFDKTGTLTNGTPQVTDVTAFAATKQELLTLAAALEQQSEHPLGRAIAAKAAGLPLPTVEDFASFAGFGIGGTVDGVRCFAGNRKLMETNGVDPAAADALCAQFSGEGKTPLLIARDGTLLGVIAVADAEKPTAKATVHALHGMGVESVMLTGDNARTARAVGERLAIDTVIADVLPQNKDAAVRDLQGQGKVVAMVGDGINDAPALSRADVGVAIGNGTDIAIESADLVLMRKDLRTLVTAVRLSRAVIRNIRLSLFWAFFYNVIAIPLAAGVFDPAFGVHLSPMIGAAAMSMSSVCVVLNALRLRRFAPTAEETAPLPADDTAEPYRIKNSETESTNTERNDEPMKKIIEVNGMHCGHCAAAVEKELCKLDGVKKAKADHEANRAVVTLGGDVTDDAIKAAVERAGFECGAIETKKGLFG
ncbi:MAG: heavy metal translocating P-type ATPase [Clostridia bacterium]|nr:heavy metal translocating P-type ATPase [Clostridia bacterium]